MNRMIRREVPFLLALFSALAFAGCGGGGASGEAAAGAQVRGAVVSQDGQPSAVGGVLVTCEATGAAVTTGPDGTFTFEVPEGVSVRLTFSAQALAGLAAGLPDCGELGDATPDDADGTGDGVDLGALGSGEIVNVEVELADGRVVECGVARGEGGGLRMRCEGALFPTEPGLTGFSLAEIEISQADGCATIEVEAEQLEAGRSLSLVLVAPDGARETLASAAVDGGGVLHLSLTRCAGDPLPFGVASVRELAGHVALVEDQDGVVVLAGQVPGFGPEPGEDGFEGFEPPPWWPDLGELPPPPTPEELEELRDLLEGLLGGGLGGGLPPGFSPPGGFTPPPGFPR